MERLYKTNKCDNCFYHEEHYLGMEGTVDICYAQKRNEFLGGVVLNHTYKNNIKCDKYENTIQHYKKIDKKLKKYDKLEEENRQLKEAINILKDRLIAYQGMEFQKRWYDGEEEYHYFLAFDENFEIELVNEVQFKLLKEVLENVKEN